MDISNKLTEEKLLEILVTSYIKGQENENIQMIDLVEEMKHQILTVIATNK